MGDTGVLVATRLSRYFNVIGISTKPNLVVEQELGKQAAVELVEPVLQYATATFKTLADVKSMPKLNASTSPLKRW